MVVVAVLAATVGAGYGVVGLSEAAGSAWQRTTDRNPQGTTEGNRQGDPQGTTEGTTEGTTVAADEEQAVPTDAEGTTESPGKSPTKSARTSAGKTGGKTGGKPVLSPGEHGRQVRELQARLAQIAWFTPPMTGRYDGSTTQAVTGFQRKRGFGPTGVVDARTWKRVLAMTVTPSQAVMFNRAGPPLLEQGAQGPQVRELQARLRQIAWFDGNVTDHYGPQTTASVRGFQGKREVPVTGKVDQHTLDLLEAMTSEPTPDELANRAPDPAAATVAAALDPRCLTGRVMCIDKTSSSLRWVVDGRTLTTVDVRFGAEATPTREGLFQVDFKSRDHVSTLFGSAMPFAMFFSGGEAVHYSSDFAARGYAGASHGCVNVRDYDAIAALFDQVHRGDKVVVYWS